MRFDQMASSASGVFAAGPASRCFGQRISETEVGSAAEFEPLLTKSNKESRHSRRSHSLQGREKMRQHLSVLDGGVAPNIGRGDTNMRTSAATEILELCLEIVSPLTR